MALSLLIIPAVGILIGLLVNKIFNLNFAGWKAGLLGFLGAFIGGIGMQVLGLDEALLWAGIILGSVLIFFPFKVMFSKGMVSEKRSKPASSDKRSTSERDSLLTTNNFIPEPTNQPLYFHQKSL